MRAIRYERFGGPVAVVEVPDPTPEPDGAVVEVALTGLCRSDFHAWAGHDGDVVLPCVPGHEYAGTVRAAPADPALVGRRVVVPFVCACGSCPECRRGAGQICRAQRQPGFTDPGSFARFVAVPHARVNVVPLPDDVSDAAAAALGCRFATAWRALESVARLRPGESVAIYGGGGVGLAAVMIARALGAHPLVVDISAGALRAATALGATAIHAEPTEDPDEIAAAVLAHCPDGTGCGVDALGSPVLAAASLTGLRRGGRHVQVGLLDRPWTALPLGLVVARELRVLGSHGMAASDYPDLLAAVVAGTVRPDRLVTETMSLAQAAAALPAMAGAGGPGGIRLIDPAR